VFGSEPRPGSTLHAPPATCMIAASLARELAGEDRATTFALKHGLFESALVDEEGPMGVPCPGCGRQYDVALFPFGRTIHCTCGRRVGLEARVRFAEPEGAPRFIADAMLGRLARWLRIMGFDSAYDGHIEDADLMRRSLEEQRAVLTRDRALPDEWRVTSIYVVASETGVDQLREVVRAFDLRAKVKLFTRCSVCNARLDPVSRDSVRSNVPERIFTSHEDFRRCPECTRVYWRGSHADRMERTVARILADS